LIELNKIYNEDCLLGLKNIPDNFITLTVTSPPYDNLRKYNDFVWNFESVAKELYRVTKEGGIVVWVVGDATIQGSETGTSFKQALYFKECGFKLHDTMIYAKTNPIPQNHNRYEQSFEFMFVLSKGKPATFNPLLTETKNKGKEFEWGNRQTVMDDNQCRRHRASDKRKVNATKVRNNIFYYSIGGGRTGHPAVFPEKLAEDHILSWSNEGDIVLDPFMGSGTTAKMAILNKRNYIGFEISTGYCGIAQKRLQETKYLKNEKSTSEQNGENKSMSEIEGV